MKNSLSYDHPNLIARFIDEQVEKAGPVSTHQKIESHGLVLNLKARKLTQFNHSFSRLCDNATQEVRNGETTLLLGKQKVDFPRDNCTLFFTEGGQVGGGFLRKQSEASIFEFDGPGNATFRKGGFDLPKDIGQMRLPSREEPLDINKIIAQQMRIVDAGE